MVPQNSQYRPATGPMSEGKVMACLLHVGQEPLLIYFSRDSAPPRLGTGVPVSFGRFKDEIQHRGSDEL